MAKAEILLDQTLDISERFRVELKVFEIETSEKYPEGIKVRFILLDVIRKVPRLLVDNHAPFGFHVHEKLPENKESRRTLSTTDYFQALDEFWRLTKEITDDKN
jgi:hypothetical protein